MFKIIDHEADTTIRFFYSSIDEIVTSIIKSFQETVLGRSEDLEWGELETINIAIDCKLSYKFLAIDLFNDMIFLMEEKDIFPVEVKKISFNGDANNLEIIYGKCLNVRNYNAIPKAATTNSGKTSDQFFDITLDL